MIQHGMMGVIIWSDTRASTAIVWCEDHGDLALYEGPQTCADRGTPLDTGDLIKFDLEQMKKLRFVHNPQLVAEGGMANLPKILGQAAGASSPTVHPPQHHTRPVVRHLKRA